MSLNALEGKKVHHIETRKHLYYHTTTGIDITFKDGTILHISGDIHTKVSKGDPPQEKKLPWRENEKKFLKSLSETDKEEYLKARKAFFWLLENKQRVKDRYSYFNESWREMTPSFGMEINMDANSPEDILTIFFSSYVSPECDDWFVLGKKRDWKRILEMQSEVINGKPKIELKEYWCQEKLDFCRCDGTNEAHQEVAKALEEEMLDDNNENNG